MDDDAPLEYDDEEADDDDDDEEEASPSSFIKASPVRDKRLKKLSAFLISPLPLLIVLVLVGGCCCSCASPVLYSGGALIGTSTILVFLEEPFNCLLPHSLSCFVLLRLYLVVAWGGREERQRS